MSSIFVLSIIFTAVFLLSKLKRKLLQMTGNMDRKTEEKDRISE